MDLYQVARDNHALYCAVVPLHMCKRLFASAVLESLDQPVLYSVEHNVYSGYILINTTDIEMNHSQERFTREVLAGLLGRVALEFPRTPTGEMNTDVTVVYEIWKFTFKITKYERDSAHRYEPVEDPLPLPDGEKLGRFIELKITIVGSPWRELKMCSGE